MQLTHRLSIYLEATLAFIEVTLAERRVRHQQMLERRVIALP